DVAEPDRIHHVQRPELAMRVPPLGGHRFEFCHFGGIDRGCRELHASLRLGRRTRGGPESLRYIVGAWTGSQGKSAPASLSTGRSSPSISVSSMSVTATRFMSSNAAGPMGFRSWCFTADRVAAVRRPCGAI